MNEACKLPAMNLGLARVYLKHSDPLVATRTWQHAIALCLPKDPDNLFFAEFALSHSSAALSSRQNSPFVTSSFPGSGHNQAEKKLKIYY
jgi:hypothetical protein